MVAQAVLSLLVSLINKGNPLKYKAFLKMIVELSSYLVGSVEQYKRSYRKQGAIKNMIKLTKEVLVVTLQKAEDVLIELMTSLMGFFGNYIANKAKKGKDLQYFIVKGGLSLTCKIVVERKKLPDILSQNRDLVRVSYAVISCCATNADQDTKLKLWVGELIPPIMEFIKEALVGGKLQAEQTLSIHNQYIYHFYGLLALLKLTADCNEIQDAICEGDNFHNELVPMIMQNHHQNSDIIAITVALIRRLAGRFKVQIAELYLFTLVTIVQMRYRDESLANIFLLKEAIAAIGVLASENEHREALRQSESVIPSILQAARAHLKHPKLLKTALGCLINLSATAASTRESGDGGDSGVELLSKDPSYYQILYTVTEDEQYNQSRPLIEYILRLINNTATNQISLQNYLSGSLLKKIVDYIEKAVDNKQVSNLQTGVTIVHLSFQVLRILVSGGGPKGLLKLELVLSPEQTDSEAAFGKLIKILCALWKALASLQFIATPEVPQCDASMRADKQVVECIQGYIGKVQKITGEDVKKRLLSITECLAYLPIEEMGLVS